ncbi:hypothetical protein JCM19301_3467 [Jejuia pallidilutea]|uniref:Uncharacterized protein n=1 Tax=Jejuia pallidilutea TaxID=504487 RepID=A0A090WE27_9FLAO|nr:hypothetical protein JCM19301_3467 [Jejuia pallidilutea]GAL72467.1 hypothetical protein JCM19302_1589 [Jejuia pallidilutea]GAL88562.1 hypothetical protein JCM19538_3075 [Jejuia pallidilutea]
MVINAAAETINITNTTNQIAPIGLGIPNICLFMPAEK